MKLNETEVIIETRSDIDLLQAMIESYLKNSSVDKSTKEMLVKLENQLDGLYYSW